MMTMFLHSRRLIFCIFCFGVLAALQTSPIHAACPGPVSGWSYWANLSIANSGDAATAPLLWVNVDTATLISQDKMRADSGDIRFTDTNCNLLNHWVETGINTAATRIWVLAGATPAGVSQLRMYYGAPAATFANDPAPVWGNGIAALYTFGEGSGTTVADHVGGFNLTLSGGVTWASGFRPGIGALTGFNSGRANHPGAGPLLGAANFTAFGFIYPTDVNPLHTSAQGIVGNYNTDNISGWVAKLQGGAGRMMLLTNQGGDWCQDYHAAFVNNTWASFGAERDTVIGHTIYQNGVSQGVSCPGDTRDVTTGAPGPLEVGRSYAGYSGQLGSFFEGSISLVAIYTQALGATTEAALHNALVQGGNINVALGGEVTTTITTITGDTPDTSVVGETVTANYSVTAGAGTPTGTVTVSDGAGTTCTGTLPATSCTLTFTSAGARTLTATYSGDPNFNGSTSASVPHQVDQAATTTTITSDDPDPSAVGETVTVSYTVAVTAPGTGTPTGTVTVSDGAGTTCTGTLPATSCTLTFPIAGARMLTAAYAGDDNFGSSTSSSAEPHTVLARTARGDAGGGLVTADITGGTCIGYAAGSTAFTPAPTPLPPGITFPYGVFGFTVVCPPENGTVTLFLTYPNPLPPGTQYWKYGPTADNTSAHWYMLPLTIATITGNKATITITDGGLGDDDLTADGDIEDQGGPGVPGAGNGGSTAIPTLSTWALLLFSALLGLLGSRRPRRHT